MIYLDTSVALAQLLAEDISFSSKSDRNPSGSDEAGLGLFGVSKKSEYLPDFDSLSSLSQR